MKKIFILLLAILGFIQIQAQTPGCSGCPDLISIRDTANCSFVELHQQAPDPNFSNTQFPMKACQGSQMKYCIDAKRFDSTTYCTLSAFQIDTVIVVGGTLINFSNTCFTIQWGNSSTGNVQIQFSVPGGSTGNSCAGNINLFYNLTPNPIAAFTIAPNPACFNNPTNISFNSSSSVGAVTYFWNFGDGFTSTSANPTHAYTTPGTYNVCLTVTNNSGGTSPIGGQNPCFTCSDSICQTVVINNLPGPDIYCIATVCAGESATYCTNAICSNYNWVVTGGTITSGANTPCITVQWGSGNPQGNIHLDVPGCAGFCPQGTDITVPIIPLSTNIIGANVVCVGSTISYSLPTLPGTTYSWSISGGQFINGNNTNTTVINTTWNNIGTYTITCVYYDTALNCGGTGTIVVNVLPEMKVLGPVKRCAGQFSTLNAVIDVLLTPVNCNWSISPGGATIVGPTTGTLANFNWANAGTYVVVATPVSPNIVCAPVSFTVIVYPKPVISAITGPDTICKGGISVHAVISNMSGLSTWTITGGTPTLLGANNDSVQINWNPVGPYSISVSQSWYANNCPSLPFIKTIQSYANPILSGASNVCADNIETYTVTNQSGSNFNWSISPAQYGTITSAPGVNPVTIKWHGNNNPGGSNTVYLHYGKCGTDSIAITINEPIATITSSGTICSIPGITLSTTGGGTYSWSCIEHPIMPTQPLNNASISNIHLGGHYTVLIQNYNNIVGCNVSSVINIPDIGRPDAQIFAGGPTIYCSSSLPSLPNMNLNAVTGVGYSYQWFLVGTGAVGTGSSFNVNSSLVNGVGTFVFYCVVTLGGCTDTSNAIAISVINCTGNGTDTTTPCGAAFNINNITGCNPFTLSLSSPTPGGSSYVPLSTFIYHYEDGSIINGNTTKYFNSIGVKQVKICADVLLPNATICRVCRDTFVSVGIAANFLANNNCGVIALTNLSTVLAPATITSYNWSVSPSGSFNNNAIASPTLTVTFTNTYTITLTVTSSTGCVTSSVQTVSVSLPDADFNVSNSCIGTTVNLNNLFPAPVNAWNFGDATSSNTSPTFHAYANSGPFNITHVVTDAFGCTHTVTKTINISPKPFCNITVGGPLSFCLGDSVQLTACPGFTNYQWQNNGLAIAGATNAVYYAKQTGNYSFTATNNLGCDVESDTISVNVLQSPNATMIFSGKKCFGELYTSSVPSCAGCLFIWEVDGIVFQVGASNQYAQTVGNLPYLLGSHQIKVTVIGANGCMSQDSANVVFNPQPTVSISVVGNPPQLCANNIYTFTATSNAASPAWAWTFNNLNPILSTTYSLTASTAGTYNVLVTDGVTGCTNTNSQLIEESPDLTLFPIGCDTLCQNATIFLPLPSFGGNISGYTISWFDNAPPYSPVIATGASINLSSLSLGTHNLSVIVVGPNGCVDTSNVYNIFIVPATSSYTSASACGTYTWTVNNITYTASGTYTQTSLNANGCPHNDTLNLTITNSAGSSTSATTCDAYTWNINGVIYTASGTYTHTITLANGCLQIDTLILIVGGNIITTQSVTACGSYFWAINGQTYTASGTYTHTIVSPIGCDKIHILHLVIVPNINTTQTVIACDAYTWNGVTYTTSGIYTHTYLNSNGCVNTATLILTINYTTISTTCVTTCGSYTWPINGVTYTASGTYSHSVITSTGCCHYYILCLTIHPNTSSNLNATSCDSYLWAANGFTYSASGTYTHTSLNANGCLHTSTLILNIIPNTSATMNATACNSYLWTLNGMTYTSSGTYTYTSVNLEGCTHTVTLNLTILTATNSTLNVVACDAYTWNGVTYTSSGTYTHTQINTNGCLHTTTLNLTINTSSIITSYINSCVPYTWVINGVTYTASGNYTVMTIGPNGCPRLYVLCLVIYPATTTTTTATACNSYYWSTNGVTYTTSGTYTHTSLNAFGCVKTSILNLTIYPSSNYSTTATACNSYTWAANGVSYTNSGIYTITLLNVNGCISTSTLVLTIKPSIVSSTTITACDQFLWPINGVTYTLSGTYTHTVMNGFGCVNTHTLILTINQNTSSTVSATACDTYLWQTNGLTYTASGSYTFTTMNTIGCIHTTTLVLTIVHSTETTTTVVACDMYTWPVNGITYTASGTYTYTSLNAVGCTNTQILVLVLGSTSIITDSCVTACCSYTWNLNGVTYTNSGVYSFISIGADGCPRFYILCLTVYPCTPTSTTVIACGNYTWPTNGTTYTVSGTYTATTINEFGCPITDSLVLTISGGLGTVHILDTACGPYTWALNGITYTSSGIYPFVALDSNGCPTIYSLCITILPHNETVLNVTAINTYTWNLNGITYTNSGMYSVTYTNSAGCDSIIILNLNIVIQPTNISITARAMLNGPYVASTGMMHDSLRKQNVIPPTEPYSSAPLFKLQLLGGGGETTTSAILSVTGNNAIVDWVHIEIRSGSNSNLVIATKNALIQRDGDIVSSTDGISPLSFAGLTPGSYFVSVKHRNHLGVMIASPINLTTGLNSIDFTNTPLYVSSTITSNTAAKTIGAVNVMWSGDPNYNKNVKYNGTLNDKDPILSTVGIATPNNCVYGYRFEDLNMDGMVRYNNTDNDRIIILNNVGTTTPNKVLYQHTPN